VIRTGTMLAGDTFVGAALVDAVRASFPDALSTDMESTALAQVAHAHAVPFVSVRGISDLCGPVAQDDFLTHVDDAAERSAAVVLGLLRATGALSKM
jgi:adenosylhomocysteine nucleosidase